MSDFKPNSDIKKICLIIPSLQAGGMERVMTEIAAGFSLRQGVRVVLVLYGITREIFYIIPDNIEIHKPGFRFNNRTRTISSLRTLLYLRKKVKEINPDSILSFGEYWNNFVLLSLTGLRYPVFVSDRAQPGKSLGRFHDNLRHFLYKKAKGIILQTEKAREIYLKNNSHTNIKVIGNPIRKISVAYPDLKKENRILMVGRLINTKHQDLLIRMFEEVSPVNWELMLVGYDHLKQKHLERLKILAKDLGIENRVKFTGKFENVDELYLSSSIFAFTSSSEGFPNAVGEAMAARLPVIAWDCVAGPSEMIRDGYNGFLVPLFDKEQFKSKLTMLIENISLREELGKNAEESIREFSEEKICDAFFNFITA